MTVPGQAKIFPSCCSLGFLAALTTTGHYRATTGPADFKVAWLLGLSEKSLPGSGKIFPGLTFLRLLRAPGQPGGRSGALGPRIGLLTMGQFFVQVAQQPQGMISFGETTFTVPMNFRLLGAGAAIAAAFLVPQQAHALVATTEYKAFKLYDNPALNTPSFLEFTGFNSLVGPGFNLTGLGFKIAGNADGTGSAMVGGNPRASNGSETDTQAFISYAPSFSFQSLAGGIPNQVGPAVGPSQNATPNPVNCVGTQSCPGLGGNMIPSESFRTLNLQGSYNGSGGFSSVDGTWSGPMSGNGVRLINGDPNFQKNTGTGPGLAIDFDPPLSSSVLAKPFIMGFVAVQYEYTNPNAPVPGPLPLFGAAAAFGWSRRLRKRVSSAA